MHLPFCVSKCRYCDFNSYAWSGQSLSRHVDAVLAEARLRAPGLQPQTLFIGGGTPSLLPPDLLARLLEELDAITGFRASSKESTLEANPESWDAATAAAAMGGGLNRVSVGVQSLRKEVLAAYDRVHSPQQALAALQVAKQAGFARWSADLIFAFPGQDPLAWQKELATVLELRPAHLSCYELSYEPGTALTRLRDAGRWQEQDADVAEQLFHQTATQCTAAGLRRYEVSNFSRPGEECLHNLAYWRSYDWIGIGAGAGSWQARQRRSNLARPDEYENAILAGRDPLAAVEAFDARRTLFDVFMMGLRLVDEGVDLDRATLLSGLDPRVEWATPLRQLQDEQLLTVAAGRARVSARGLLLLDSVLHRLLPDREL